MAKRIIKPDSGNTLVLQEDNGSIDALTVETNGNITFGGIPDFPNGLTLASNTTGGNITGVTLNDYEEGTFSLSGAPIYTTTCKYIKIGDLVTLHGRVQVTGVTEVAPFTSSSVPFSCGSYDGAGSIIGDTDQSEIGSIGIDSGSKNLRFTFNQSATNLDYLSFSITYSTD